MNTHTPGPWRVDSNRVAAYVYGPGNFCIARMGDVGDVNRDANAALIASAPDLLAILQELLRGGNGSTAPILSAARKHSPGWLRDARAAVAKATGSAA